MVNNQDLTEPAKNAGADMVITASATVGHLLALSAVTKNLVGVVFSEKIGTQEIAEFSIFKSSKLIGKGVQEVSKLAAIIGVVRDEKVVKKHSTRPSPSKKTTPCSSWAIRRNFKPWKKRQKPYETAANN